MKLLRSVPLICALWLFGSGVGSARAAWNNVFQVCCFSCRQPNTVSNYAPAPCPTPCPQPTCTTQYVQRCYYQPVTNYETRSYYEPVTSYRTSYYYEPMTSYRYVSYYDPCNCSCQQVAVPTTSYRLRSQCCPVQNWVQRCYQVAVTNYQQVSYYEPVTSCNYPQPACPPAQTSAPPPAVSTIPGAPANPPQPGVSEQRTPGTGANGTGSGSPLYDRYYPSTPSNPLPPASGSSLRPVPQPLPVTPPAPVKLERIVAIPGPMLQGQVVSRDNAPRSGAKLIFVNAARQGQQHPVTADARGQFRVTLASGAWYVYLTGADGRAVLDSKIELRDHENLKMTLVSR